MNRLFFRNLGVLVAVITPSLPCVLQAAEYRTLPLSYFAEPGETVSMWMEVETRNGDNAVGFGYYSFAADLTLAGSSPVSGSAVGNVVVNTAVFNHLGFVSSGGASGNQWNGIRGVTTDTTPPNPGAAVGDIVRLFDFSFTVPLSALEGDTFTITPSEVQGSEFGNKIVNPTFDTVSPQTFVPSTVIIVPEPASLILFLIPFLRRSRHRNSRCF